MRNTCISSAYHGEMAAHGKEISLRLGCVARRLVDAACMLALHRSAWEMSVEMKYSKSGL